MKAHGLLFLIASVVCIEVEDIALENFAKGNNAFSSKLHKELSKTNGTNFIVSPLSAETALTLTAFGAKGDTASELFQCLNRDPDTQKAKTQFQAVQSHMNSGKFGTLSSANKLYVEKGFGIVPEFLAFGTDAFGTGVENVNFGESGKTANKINQWVEGETNGKIKDLLSADELSPLTRLVLVNALYFKGQWSNPFEKDNTKPRKFYKTKTETVDVETMETIGSLQYAVNEKLNAKFIQLPYRGMEVVLTIVLPNEVDGLTSLENDIEEILKPQNYTRERIKLFLPKFKVETTHNLIPTLQNMGVKKIFNRDADLSGISIIEGLYVSNVIQKVFIDVNEVGTEAAAATAVISNARSLGGRVSRLEIKVDHPFLFFLKLKNVVLFGGRISNL